MLEKLEQIERSYEELTEQISQPEFMSDMSAYAKLMKQHRSLGEIVEKYREVRRMQEELQGARDLLALADDDEMREMANLEIAELEEKLPAAEEELARLFIGRCYVTVERLTGLLRHLEFDGLAGLFLAYGRTIDSVTMRSNILHPQADDVASSKLAIDR